MGGGRVLINRKHGLLNIPIAVKAVSSEKDADFRQSLVGRAWVTVRCKLAGSTFVLSIQLSVCGGTHCLNLPVALRSIVLSEQSQQILQNTFLWSQNRRRLGQNSSTQINDIQITRRLWGHETRRQWQEWSVLRSWQRPCAYISLLKLTECNLMHFIIRGLFQ